MIRSLFSRDPRDSNKPETAVTVPVERIEFPEKSLSILKDPFSRAKITDVDLHWYVRDSIGVRCYGRVTFQNGSTKGEQEIKAETMDELILKVRAFLESLK